MDFIVILNSAVGLALFGMMLLLQIVTGMKTPHPTAPINIAYHSLELRVLRLASRTITIDEQCLTFVTIALSWPGI